MDKLTIVSIPVSIGTYPEFIDTIIKKSLNGNNGYVCVANVHMLVEAYFDRRFANTVKNAGIITPDGLPLTWAIRMTYGIQQQRVAGMDLLPDLLRSCEAQQVPVYFYGGETTLLDTTRNYLAVAYPGLCLAGMYSPPFRKLSLLEEEEDIARINQSGARIVFVALGCPKQEKWMEAMAGRINALLIGIGGALPVMVKAQKRAPKWLQSTGLEWTYRLVQEPGRLFKRYAVTNTVFIYLLIRSYLQRRFTQHSKKLAEFPI